MDIIHHTHTDFGYTDMPSVCRDLQVRFLDAALQTCLDDKRFHWTVEGTVALDDWWRGATPQRREEFLRMVRSGQIDVMALAFNQAPFMNAAQWRRSLDWLPQPLLEAVRPRAAMQNDVNGCPRAGAMLLLDRGIRHLLMGINADSGGPPFRRPSAFWWQMPDGRRIFVWLGDHYGTAYSYFEREGWQRGQAKAADATLGPPRPGDQLRTDEASLRACHAHLTSRLKKLVEEGYAHNRLILSYTNQWRYDNDVPFPPLAPFVEAWNALGLKPEFALHHGHEGRARHGAGRDRLDSDARRRVDRLVGQWRCFRASRGRRQPRSQAQHCRGAGARLGRTPRRRSNKRQAKC